MRAVTAEQARAIAARMQPVPPLPVAAVPAVRPPFALPVTPSASSAPAIPSARPPLLPVAQPALPQYPVVPPTVNLPVRR